MIGWGALEQNAREFVMDVHCVTKNFLGEQGWKWVQEQKVEGQRQPQPWYDRFTDEMTQGTRTYTNDSPDADRVLLGLAAVPYSVLHFSARLMYDGFLNVSDYLRWRLENPMGQRLPNAHVLGAPLGGPIIIALGAAECGFRLAGFSSYGELIIASTAHVAVNMSRYTKLLFGPEVSRAQIQQDRQQLMARPRNPVEVCNRLGAPIPAAISAVMLAGAASISVIGYPLEATFRALGVPMWDAIVPAAVCRAGRLLDMYFDHLRKIPLRQDPDLVEEFKESDRDLARLEKRIFKKPKQWTDYADKVSLVTVPGAVALTLMSASVAIIAASASIEVSVRLLGGSEYGVNVAKAMMMRAANLTRYSRLLFGKYSEADIAAVDAQIKTLPKDFWQGLDRVGAIGLPFIAGSAVALTAVAISFPGIAIESVGRALGVSEFSLAFLKIVGRRAANFSKYTRILFPDVKPDEKSLVELVRDVNSGWDYVDRIALGTTTGAIAGVEVLGAGLISTIGFASETAARILGISEFGRHIIAAASIRAAMISSRYTKNLFGEYKDRDAAAHNVHLLSYPESAWDKVDRLGFVTLPAVIAMTEIAAAVAITTGLGALEATARSVGVSDYGSHLVNVARIYTSRFSKYSRALMSNAGDENNLRDSKAYLAKPIHNGWDVCDRIGSLFLPVVGAAFCFSIASVVTLACATIESTARIVGMSEYSLSVAGLAAIKAQRMSRYTKWFYNYRAERAEAAEEVFNLILNKKPETFFDYCDRVALLGRMSAAYHYVGAAVVTLIGGLIEAAVRLCGISNVGDSVFVIGREISALITKRYGNLEFHRDDFIKALKNIFDIKNIKNGWDVIDRIGCFTMPLALAAIGVAINTLSTMVLFALEITAKFLGFSCANYYRFQQIAHRFHNDYLYRKTGNAPERRYENYCKEALQQCQNDMIDRVLSHFNLLNMARLTVYYVGQRVVLPLVYLAIRAVTTAIKTLGGIIPVVKWIAEQVNPRDMNQPENKVRKRFDDLESALDIYGRLPADMSVNGAVIDVNARIQAAENRTIPAKIAHGIFSEGRRVMSLGKSPEERILHIFRQRFEEFVKVQRRNHQKIAITHFFRDDVDVSNGKRFSYDQMKDHIARTFVNPEDREAINRMGELIRREFVRVVSTDQPVQVEMGAGENNEPMSITRDSPGLP